MDTLAQGLSIELVRTFDASPARVFAAWTQAEALTAWFGPTPDITVIVHELEVREGGRFRIELRPPSGPTHIVHGVFTTVLSPWRLVMTWTWEGLDELPTAVQVDFAPVGADQCRLTLRHSRFATEASRAGHDQGWNACLDRLVSAVARAT